VALLAVAQMEKRFQELLALGAQSLVTLSPEALSQVILSLVIQSPAVPSLAG